MPSSGPPCCEILCDSDSPHLAQIYTGFAMLHRAGEILLSQRFRNRDHFEASKPQHLRDASYTHLLVAVNQSIKLYYDCHDSFEIDERAASEVDCYFKRSYAPNRVPDNLKSRVFPLGLNYELYIEDDRFEQERLCWFQEKLSNDEFRPTIENMHAAPDHSLGHGVLFITRTWDPFDNADRSEHKIGERISTNETRAHCIRLLRKEFSDRFLGGFIHTDYAAKNYAGALLSSNEISEKQNYIKLLRQYPVCVTTTGLHGSIGWKMGEYVAFSRAIVSESLNYEVPGDFRQSKNYLAFNEPDQCIKGVHDLLTDDDLRYRMMQANHEYYRRYLKPDAMIRRTLKIGLTGRD